MKYHFIFLLAWLISTPLWSATFIPDQSSIRWTGRKLTGVHKGGLSIDELKSVWDKNTLKHLIISVDMQSLSVEEGLADTWRNKLRDHLLSEDFFDATRHPQAIFELTRLVPVTSVQWNAEGKLTIKGITQAVQFPVDVQLVQGTRRLKASLTLDRTLWKLSYRVPTALGQQVLSQVIQKNFNLDISLAFAN